MKQIIRKILILLTALLFTGYAAYNGFVIIRDSRNGMSFEGKLISGAVAFAFALLAAYAFTVGLNVHSLSLAVVRSTAFILSMLGLFALKVRMIDDVIKVFDVTEAYSVLYTAAYFATLIAMLLLLVYYAFIIRRLPRFPRASVIFPLVSLILFTCGFICEIVLFGVYGVGLEANTIRTVLSRPTFYLGFMGLSAYFLIPPELPKQ